MTKDDKITTLTPNADRPTRDEAEKAIKTLLQWVGEDSAREGLIETPKRVIKAFDEYTQGYAQDPAQILSKTFENEGEYHGPVIVTDIAVESHCEHHLAPFVGMAHIAYIPNNRIVGLSKLARLVDCFSKRLQVQERLTSQIANALEEHLDTKGVAVMIEAEHYCMKMRGVKKDHTKTITYVFLGEYKDDKMQERFLQKVGSRSRD